ncbi:MAG TPA: hypothetical protein VLY24_27390 [Bryobacteraceae bacterium]|nr:hypothetical protein [Bryobacteraceae bacterium]
MELILWLLLPFMVAVGTASLVWTVMQARIRVISANCQAEIAKVESDCAARRPGVEELLSELRFERNRFLRRVPGPHGSYQATVITQERIYFREIPLTGWIQDELQLGDGEELVPINRELPECSATALQPVAIFGD